MIFQINENEAPQGFYAVSKDAATTSNVCASCDARALCIRNENDWALNNRCMSYEVTADGKTYSRIDKMSVIFKLKLF